MHSLFTFKGNFTVTRPVYLSRVVAKTLALVEVLIFANGAKFKLFTESMNEPFRNYQTVVNLKGTFNCIDILKLIYLDER